MIQIYLKIAPNITSLIEAYMLKLKVPKANFKGVIHVNNTALVITIIGALNWLLIGLFGFDLVGAIFGGQMAILSRIIFVIVGLAGLWCINLLFKEKISPRSAA